MIADDEATVVYVADTLERRFPPVHGGLKAILDRYGVPLRTIPGTRDIWCRDYMPIQVAEGRFVQFRYSPDYLGGRYGHLKADGEIGPTLPLVERCDRSDIVLDGGNVVRWAGRVILTEKVFRENAGSGRRWLMAELGRLLMVEDVLVIPEEPGDVVGHADGIVAFVDEETVLVNDYARIDPAYRRALRAALRRARLNVLEVPYRPDRRINDGIPSAVGCYLNYLQVGRVLIVPEFGRPEDETMATLLGRVLPDMDVHGLAFRALAEEGGAVHCITWNVSDRGASRPSRFSHATTDRPRDEVP